MKDDNERVRGLIGQEAAEWFVANRAGLLPEQRQTFATWLQTSPVHVQEYLSVAAVARDLREACSYSAESIDLLVERARTAEADTRAPSFWESLLFQRTAISAAVIALLSTGLFFAWRFMAATAVPAPEQITALHFATGHGQQATYRLADNSILHLNTDSAVMVRYSKTTRTVVLTSGEADFEVVHDVKRPFRVVAGPAEVLDLGTKFDVRMEPDSTVVTVVEGRVGVSRNGDNAVQLGENQQIRVTAAGTLEPAAVDARSTTAWLHRQIKFEHEPLERVAREFNRYSGKPIEIATPSLRTLEISGVFATDDTEAFVAFLRSLQGVHVEVSATRIRVSRD
jgi:transmembrane sensor